MIKANNKFYTAIFSSILLASSTLCFAEQVYRWVDKNGNVHFSESPPPNQKKEYEKINIETQEKTGAVFASEKMIKDLKSENTSSKAEENNKQKTADKKQNDLEKYCEEKRRKLVEIESYMQHRHTLLDEQKVKTLRTLIKSECH